MIFIQLFTTFFLIGLFSFGGGYAAMPWILSLVVEERHWLTMAEYADLTAIAEMTPGPIGVNAATFVGTRMAGLPGAIVCTLGCITPSLIIVLILAFLYKKYKDLALMKAVLNRLRPVVVALVASAGLTIFRLAMFGEGGGLADIRYIEAGIFVAALLVLRSTKISSILVLLSSAAIGTVLYLLVR